MTNSQQLIDLKRPPAPGLTPPALLLFLRQFHQPRLQELLIRLDIIPRFLLLLKHIVNRLSLVYVENPGLVDCWRLRVVEGGVWVLDVGNWGGLEVGVCRRGDFLVLCEALVTLAGWWLETVWVYEQLLWALTHFLLSRITPRVGSRVVEIYGHAHLVSGTLSCSYSFFSVFLIEIAFKCVLIDVYPLFMIKLLFLFFIHLLIDFEPDIIKILPFLDLPNHIKLVSPCWLHDRVFRYPTLCLFQLFALFPCTTSPLKSTLLAWFKRNHSFFGIVLHLLG